GKPLVLAQDDSFEHSAALAAHAVAERTTQPGVDPIGNASKTIPSADLAPPVAAQDDVDATVPEPGSLVEAVLGSPRALEDSEHLEHRALRRSPTRRKLEEDRLVRAKPTKTSHPRRRPELEAGPAHRPGDLHERALRPPDVREQHARVERVEARAPPPE